MQTKNGVEMEAQNDTLKRKTTNFALNLKKGPVVENAMESQKDRMKRRTTNFALKKDPAVENSESRISNFALKKGPAVENSESRISNFALKKDPAVENSESRNSMSQSILQQWLLTSKMVQNFRQLYQQGWFRAMLVSILLVCNSVLYCMDPTVDCMLAGGFSYIGQVFHFLLLGYPFHEPIWCILKLCLSFGTFIGGLYLGFLLHTRVLKQLASRRELKEWKGQLMVMLGTSFGMTFCSSLVYSGLRGPVLEADPDPEYVTTSKYLTASDGVARDSKDPNDFQFGLFIGMFIYPGLRLLQRVMQPPGSGSDA